MWYTPVSGIWQSVWLEPVCEEHITSLRIDCGRDWVEIRVYGISSGVITLLGEKYRLIAREADGELCASIHADIQHPHLWTPDDPHLYTFTVESESGDKVSSYFALRTLTIEERNGYKRLCLNGEPYFFNGLLDQGYWQDGIYTPQSPDKFTGDILAMKSLGFNTLRKHIKIEHEQFYYDCDRLGMVVFQDMVNNSDYSFLRDTALPTVGLRSRSDRNAHKGKSRRVFLESMDETVRLLYNHPSICYWTIFNEGWGQFDADGAYDRLKALDSSRFIDSTSGWFHQNKSDVDSYHVYFKPVELKAENRPLVLSEFGGYACKIADHCYNREKTYGYRKCEDEAALLNDIVTLYRNEILPLRDKGLCAAIYTQVSDVEDETNGILTYDREILKFRSYTGSGSMIILGSHTEQQGGKVIAVPSEEKVRAYVAENHRNVIRISINGAEPSEVSITDRNEYEEGTDAALVTGILEGFNDLFGTLDGEGSGFDAHIELSADTGGGSSGALTMLICRMINDRYYGGKADASELAKIAVFAEREYCGRPCGMAERLMISQGNIAVMDFSGREPEIEILEPGFEDAGYEMQTVQAENGAAAYVPDGTAAPVEDDMAVIAQAIGVSRLGDLNEEQFRRHLPDLKKKVKNGELTELQIDRARYFYDENDRVLAATIALRTNKTDRFMQCVNGSGLSSERVLRDVIPEGVDGSDLSKTLQVFRSRPDTAAVRPVSEGSAVRILVIRRK